jgi:hypothetical protein
MQLPYLGQLTPEDYHVIRDTRYSLYRNFSGHVTVTGPMSTESNLPVLAAFQLGGDRQRFAVALLTAK